MIEGRPKAILGWINLGGVRTPIYLCDLDSAKLRQAPSGTNTYFYDEITVDPRFEALCSEPYKGHTPPDGQEKAASDGK